MRIKERPASQPVRAHLELEIHCTVACFGQLSLTFVDGMGVARRHCWPVSTDYSLPTAKGNE